MSPQLLEAELNGNTNEEFELIRFKKYLLVVDKRVTVSKSRLYGNVRDSAVNAGLDIERSIWLR